MGLSPVIGCPDPMLSFNLSHLLHPSLASLFPLLHPAAFFSCPFELERKKCRMSAPLRPWLSFRKSSVRFLVAVVDLFFFYFT